MTRTGRPHREEANEYYFRYIDLVSDEDICAVLDRQLGQVRSFFGAIPDSRRHFRYAPGKWSIGEVLAHVNDTERVLVSRAHWFARGFDSPLPSFDQHVAASHAGADARPLADHIEEFGAVRAATLQLFAHLPADAWSHTGTASGYVFSVRALAYLIAGHVEHHIAMLKERYGG